MNLLNQVLLCKQRLFKEPIFFIWMVCRNLWNILIIMACLASSHPAQTPLVHLNTLSKENIHAKSRNHFPQHVNEYLQGQITTWPGYSTLLPPNEPRETSFCHKHLKLVSPQNYSFLFLITRNLNNYLRWRHPYYDYFKGENILTECEIFGDKELKMLSDFWMES